MFLCPSLLPFVLRRPVSCAVNQPPTFSVGHLRPVVVRGAWVVCVVPSLATASDAVACRNRTHRKKEAAHTPAAMEIAPETHAATLLDRSKPLGERMRAVFFLKTSGGALAVETFGACPCVWVVLCGGHMWPGCVTTCPRAHARTTHTLLAALSSSRPQVCWTSEKAR